MKRMLDGLLFGLGFAIGFAIIQFLAGAASWVTMLALSGALR